MNTETSLDALTSAVTDVLNADKDKPTLSVTKHHLLRSYSLTSTRSRMRPFGQFQVHVIITRDSTEGIAVFNNYGTDHRGAASAREGIDLNNTATLAAEIAQYLMTGLRG